MFGRFKRISIERPNCSADQLDLLIINRDNCWIALHPQLFFYTNKEGDT